MGRYVDETGCAGWLLQPFLLKNINFAELLRRQVEVNGNGAKLLSTKCAPEFKAGSLGSKGSLLLPLALPVLCRKGAGATGGGGGAAGARYSYSTLLTYRLERNLSQWAFWLVLNVLEQYSEELA